MEMVGKVQVITYNDYMDVCRANGFEYMVVGRQHYIPVIDFFEFRKKAISIPCRDLKSGRELIKNFELDGVGGYFYIRKISFPEEPLHKRFKKWITRYT